MTSVFLFHPVKVRLFRLSYSETEQTSVGAAGWCGLRGLSGGRWQVLHAPAGSSPFHPSVQKHAQLEELLPVLFQLFRTPASLQTGACSDVAVVNGGPACVFVGFTFCDRLVLSDANTKPTPKLCHQACIRRGLLEPCKCQQDTCHSAAWLPWRQHTWQLPRTMGCWGATEMIGRCCWQTGGCPHWKISPLRGEPRRKIAVWWRMWGDEMRN